MTSRAGAMFAVAVAAAALASVPSWAGTGLSVGEPGSPQDGSTASARAFSPAYALWEITAGSNGSAVFSSDSRRLSFFGGVGRQVARDWEVGGNVAYSYQGGDASSESALQALVGPTWNLGGSWGMRDAFFISPQVGFTTGSVSFPGRPAQSVTEPTAALTAGKRFRLTDFASFAPSVGVVKEADFAASFVLTPLAFSLFF